MAIPTRVRRARPTVVLRWYGDALAREAHERLFWAAIEEAKQILQHARSMTPRKTGTLIRSSTITINKRPPMPEIFEAAGGGKRYTGKDFFDYFIPKKAPPPGKTEILISYNTPYALYQHERTDYRHAVGGPKFLQKAFEARTGAIEKNLGHAVQALFLRRR